MLMAHEVTVEKFEIAVPTVDEIFIQVVADRGQADGHRAAER
jgi:hypothetical protein